MAKGTILSIDAMGGDAAPGVVVDGVASLLADRADIGIILHGVEAALTPLVAAHSVLAGRCQIVHSDSVITSDMKPSQALRRGKGSSMWNAIEAVKTGQAGAAVSAGNTGALMAISMLILRKMEGVHRPAMTALWPTMRGRTVVLDVGANLEADAAQLVTFAIMGEAYARAALGIEKPTIGILNIGSEEMKGHDEVREAHEWLRAATLDIDYRGFVEGDDISKGAASGGLKQLRAQMDPSNVNGGVLLGLGGVSVKSHGSTDARGFAQACQLAANLAGSHYRDEILANLARIREGGMAAE